MSGSAANNESNGMSKICTVEEAVALVKSGDSVASVGVIGWITPDALLAGLARRFKSTGDPAGLTFYFPCGTGDAMDIKGMDHVAIEGHMKRIVAGSYVNPVDPKTGKRPELMRLIRENRIEAYSWPIGASMHWLREVARRGPGYLTKIGLDTYADPAQGGGKFTTLAEEDLIQRVNFKGEDYLFYPTWPLNVGFIRASTADEFGNLSFEDEPIHSSSLQIALAVKACGGTVIAQVRKVVERGSRPAAQARIPGVLVDKVVVDATQMMSTDVAHDSSFLGGQSWDGQTSDRLAYGADKIVARRAAREIRPGVTSIFGFGASSDAPTILLEDGHLTGGHYRDYQFTTEHGPFGGLVMSGWQFSANKYPEALLDGVTQFDFIDGGGCPFAALAFAQFDQQGNVNVSRFGVANPGAGGFIDIAYNATDLVFAGTFTTGGLEIGYEDGKLRIIREGKVRKFVRRADHITYPVRRNVMERGQRAKLITERAVFEVDAEGLVLIEVAPGIDARSQVLDLMEFNNVRVAPELALMDADLFRVG
ncbi:CoA-transferase [Piscinibacter sp.]|uniref:CoA-transferase n=1 Tax=Piscinibacter sp. TaxID=1903157 RepID=UPI0039E5F6A2